MPGVLADQSCVPAHGISSPTVTDLSQYTNPPLLSRLPTTILPLSFPLVSTGNNKASSKPSIGWTDSHLPSIDDASLVLHFALHEFHAVNKEYALLPYEQAFNWRDIRLPLSIEREWYIVAFRSVRRKNANTDALYRADREAHEEAVTAGGLILYWYGAVNDRGENLATCIWQSRRHALAANHNPKHAIAAKLASATYETYDLERYILRKLPGTSGLSVEPWSGGDVGY